ATKHFKPANSTRTFLDYGCGTGRFGHEFYTYFDQSWDYFGVDPSQACIKEAQEQSFSTVNLSSRSTKGSLFLTLDAWSGTATEYDFILAACVFHHIEPSQRGPILRKLWQTLRLGGAILIWEHNPWNPITRRIVKGCIFDKDAQLLSII